MGPTSTSTGTPTTPRPRALVVDDDREFVAYLRDALAAEFEVFTATTPDEALELFARHAPRLIVTDQRMPGMTGLDLLERIKARDASTVRIIVTGYGDTDVVVRALNQELVWRYFRKPFDHEEFMHEVRSARAHLASASVSAGAGSRSFLGC